MRILHTADWHLGDRLGRIDRTSDLRRAVERVADYCRQESIDVLLVAGDLFSELARPDSLRESIEHWQQVFRDFLQSGNTILTLTGNHDNETFCQTLAQAMNLAAPVSTALGSLLPGGRLYLATEPSLLRLQDRTDGFEVQFILMPYPTPTRYLRDELSQRYSGPDEKNQKLQRAFTEKLQKIQQHERFDRQLPTVLSAHVNVTGASLGATLFRLSEQEDVVIDGAQWGSEFTYVALGHIHKPQFLGGRPHVRYSGSIERMDLGERDDNKSVVVIDVARTGLQGEPHLLPIPSTPVYEIDVRQPKGTLSELRQKYAEARDDLVNIHLTYTAGVDSLEHVLKELEEIFPRWYCRDWKEAGSLSPTLVSSEARRAKGFEETVREYLNQELVNHPDIDRAEIMNRVEALLLEDKE
jgi:exonuclease SbcD